MGGNHTCIIKKPCQRIIIISFIAFLLFINTALISSAEPLKPNSSCIVIEQSTGRILSGMNIDSRLPMASTTKIVTALVVIERIDLNKVITIPREATGIEGSSIYLKSGHKWKVIDLLYGLMLRSGNDAAAALAIECGGSIGGFVKMMNDKAKKMGLDNTHFTNPHGLHHDDHYTSAYDLAMLTREGMKYDVFRKIVSSKSYSFLTQEDIRCVFVNKNKMLSFFQGANGVKTGYTKKSGRCLVSAAKRGNMQLITVALNCNDMWNESMKLMETAFDNYQMYEILKAGEPVGETRVIRSLKHSTMLVSKSDFYYPVRYDEIEKINYDTDFKVLKAPVKKNEYGGKIRILLDNHLIFTADAYTIENVEGKTVADHFKDIVRKWKTEYENQ